MKRVFRRTRLSQQGWELSDVTQYLFANLYRGAHTSLDKSGLLSPREKHAHGAQWIFWAESTEPKAKK
jgi:hypothetical protein